MSKKKSSDDGRHSAKRRIPGWAAIGMIVVAVVTIAGAVWFQQRAPVPAGPGSASADAQHRDKSPAAASVPRSRPISEAAHYVGSKSCISCHSTQAAAWQTSQHHDAMAEATEKTVLANFNDTTFAYAGITSKFFRRDDKFFAQTSGPDGKLQDYEVKYTYGLYPLQQYLVEFPDGRVQPLPIAWDTRIRQQGGQRWFHLYPDDHITHTDELFWTRPSQNWNFMCADCHSINMRKNYNAATDTFKTNWSEINVGCEACHGPGSSHLQWADLKSAGKPVDHFDNEGLTAHLDERKGVAWIHNPETGNSTRSKPRATDHEIEVCAQCHSRRGQIDEGYEAGKPFLDYYRPALLVPPLYHADGQQHDEVYTWASFLQSKMYAKGVTCSDCHNPHSGKLRAEGNAVCATCHLASKYDTEQHSHHTPDSAGAQCVACHMPTTNYMVVDPRHDHSIRVPRPDQSVTLGVPNACNQCHAKRSATWAAAQVRQWYGHDPQGFQSYATAFAAAATGTPDAQSRLQTVATDSTQPAIARATALSQLDPASAGARDILAEALRDPNGVIRLGALGSLARGMPGALVPQVVPLLSDPLRAVRIEAASLLAPVPVAQMDPLVRAAFERAIGEYVASEHYNADRANSRVNLGMFYANRGDAAKAEAEIKAALQLDPLYVPAYVNLADVYRATGRNVQGESLLREGSKRVPDNADLHFALGLALVRNGEAVAALDELKHAMELAPASARIAYVYAVALNSSGQSAAAITILEKTVLAHPDDRDVLEALVSFHQARGEQDLAEKYAKCLQALPGAGQRP